MALVSIKVPHDTARLLSSLDVPGAKVDVGYMHCTVLHLEDPTMEDVLRGIASTLKVTGITKPFVLGTRRISHFGGDGEEVPIVCPIDSSDLHDFQRALSKQFDVDGVPYSKKFPEYRPHVTLAMADAPLEEDVEQTIDPNLEWGAHSVHLWAGDHGDEKLACEFAFTMGKPALRNAVKALMLKEGLTSRR